MGAKDIEEKHLEDYDDVFADIINVNLFNGRQVVKPESLENAKDKSRFKATDGIIREQERDVAKWWKHATVRIAFLGLENQTNVDREICFRLYGYDGAAYRSQYGEKQKYPVVTLVLYMDCKRHWDGPKSLKKSLQIPDGMEKYVNDYHMNLVELAWQTDEQLKMYRSDFKIVVDYLIQMRKHKGDYTPPKDRLKHVDAILKMMTAMTGDNRFEEGHRLYEKSTGRKVNTMCEALDRIEKRGDYLRLLSMVNNYVRNKKLTFKAACEDLGVEYKEYMAAKRFIKRQEARQVKY